MNFGSWSLACFDSGIREKQATGKDVKYLWANAAGDIAAGNVWKFIGLPEVPMINPYGAPRKVPSVFCNHRMLAVFSLITEVAHNSSMSCSGDVS